MKLYRVFGATSYGSGLAIVAADSPKQAKQVLLDSNTYGFKDPMYGLEITTVKVIRGASIKRTKPGVVTAHVYIE